MQASQLQEVESPVAGLGNNANLRGVKSSLAQTHLLPKKTIRAEDLAASAELILPSIWAYRKRKLKGEPLVFRPKVVTERNLNRVRPFLEQPLNDDTKVKGYRKARQIGLSENSVTESLWFADTHDHTKVFYTFPTNRQMQDFSNTRIAEAISESVHLQTVMGDIKNVNLKKVGSSFLFLRGSQTERLGEGVDADVAFFDEIDRMSPRVKAAFEESLSGSIYGWVREISTPTVPNHGIDEGWNKSRQWFWYITCPRCRTKQTLEWLPTDDFGGRVSVAMRDGIYVYVCRHCEKELPEQARWDGEWVAKYPRRETSYYQFSQLMAPWMSAQKLYEKQEDYPFKQLFYNYCLGLPYLGDNILVTEEAIMGCRTHISRDKWQGPRALGVDWGDKSWMVCIQALGNGKIGLAGLEKIETADIDEIVPQVSQFFESMGAKIMVNDAGYGKDRNSRLLKMHEEKVFSCFYPNNEKGSKIFEAQWQDESHKVSVDRTASIKISLGMFKAKQVVIAPEVDLGLLKLFTKHLTNLVSVKDYDEKTGEISEWIASTGQDHFGHAWNYGCIALSKLVKMPKSECWDWYGAAQDARKTGSLLKPEDARTSTPRVPGFTSMQTLLDTTAGIGHIRPDKADCYTIKHGYDAPVCESCTLKGSCKKICEANQGATG
jgi:hypothetical protein